MLSPTIVALQEMDYHVDILLEDNDDPRNKELKDIIANWNPLMGLFNNTRKYNECFYIWGEPRTLPKDFLNWKITKSANSNPAIAFLKGMHEVELDFEIARHLGYKDKIPYMYCPTTESNIEFNSDCLNICIHVGSRPEPHWKKKRWPICHWITCMENLIYTTDKEVKFYLLNGFWDKEDVSEIIKEMIAFPDCIQVVENLNITQVAGIINKCEVMISTDSGPMHIAGAVDTPVVQLFGPTLPSKNNAWNSKGKVLQSNDSCVPCLYKQAFSNCINNKCMENITPADVCLAVKELI